MLLYLFGFYLIVYYVLLQPFDSKLRQLLSSEFSYETAAGYVCLCEDGFEGENCTVNIDECVRSGNPMICNNGDCKDGIASYICNCHKGFTGIK